MITIIKGDDTQFASSRKIVLVITTTVDITGFTGKFEFYGVSRAFTSAQVQTKRLEVEYTASETNGFPLGQSYATFTLFDTLGKHAVAKYVIINVSYQEKPCGDNAIDVRIENLYNYEMLENRPKINGKVLSGDQTGAFLGLVNESDDGFSYVNSGLGTASGQSVKLFRKLTFSVTDSKVEPIFSIQQYVRNADGSFSPYSG